LQLYSLNTPNGVKVSIMLEEIGLPYEPHLIDIGKDESWTPEFLSLNPNGKIPAIIDPDGPDRTPVGLAESGAILVYLADKTGQLLPQGNRRYETMQWVMWQMAHVGPMFGQVGFFNRFAGKEWEDKRPLQRYSDESKRLLGVLDGRLDGRHWVMGDDYTIADIALLGWVRNLIVFYEAAHLVGLRSRHADKAHAKLKLMLSRSSRPVPESTSWRSQLSHISSRPGSGWTVANG
jgi:GSH-dependent disulfide-bond oxidoreductase